MLDYQINESISRAYLESVCGYRHKKLKSRATNGINEDGNTVYRVQGPSMNDLELMRERERRGKLTPEEREREDRMRENARREQERQQREAESRRRQTYISAAPESPKRPEATITSREDFNRTQMRAAQATDPGMRIGRGVYDGLGYMLPGAVVGKFGKGAEIAKELSSQGARISALEQGIGKGGGGAMKWIFSPKGNAAGAALGTAANYGSDELRKRGYDKAADVVDEFKWLGAMPGPIGYGLSNLGYGRLVRGKQQNGSAMNGGDPTADGGAQTNGSSSATGVVDTRVSCNANGDGTGCGFVAANQEELDKHYETCPLVK